MKQICPRCGSASESAKFCPQCGYGFEMSALEQETEVAKVLPKSKIFMRGFLLVVLAAGLAVYLKDAFRTYHPVVEQQPAVEQAMGITRKKIASSPVQAKVEGPFIVISLQEVLDRKLVRFSDPEGIQNVPIIAYITPGGKLVTAMSISENCRSTDFYLEGDNIHCASCPSYWNMASFEAYACCQKFYPDPIPSTVLGDEIRIEIQTIRTWKTRS